MRAFGHPTSTALTISASLAQIGEFAFIIAGLGVALQILPKEGQSLVLAGALVSIMLNPLVFGLLDRWQAKQEQSPQAPEPPEAIGPSRDLHDHAIVIGYGRVGSELAQVLSDRGVPVLVIDDNKEHVEAAHAKGLAAIRGSAAPTGCWPRPILSGRRLRCWRFRSRWKPVRRWPSCGRSTRT